MQQTIATPPTPAPPSFASLLASLAAPTPRTAWNNDDLADDVATLSYEHALRAHSRYRVDDSVEPAKTIADTSGIAQRSEAPEAEEVDLPRTQASRTTSDWNLGAEYSPAHDSSVLEMNKKCASITIRLSKTECDQLRRRAAQAGLTVSAYLRSCTFEAEALRAQVKDVLAELRQATSGAEERPTATARRPWFQWVRRLMPRSQRVRRMAQA